MAAKRKPKALGLRLPPEVAEALESLIEQERQRVGPFAKVSENHFVAILILQEAEKKGLKKKR